MIKPILLAIALLALAGCDRVPEVEDYPCGDALMYDEVAGFYTIYSCGAARLDPGYVKESP